MEELTVHSVAQATKPAPVQAAINKGMDRDRLSQKKAPAETQPANPSEMTAANTSELVNQVNQFVDRFSTKVAFSFDPDSKEAQIVVTEKETGKVIRQIPPKEMLQLKKKMQEIAGIIFNGRV